jgi:hypothetical protein
VRAPNCRRPRSRPVSAGGGVAEHRSLGESLWHGRPPRRAGHGRRSAAGGLALSSVGLSSDDVDPRGVWAVFGLPDRLELHRGGPVAPPPPAAWRGRVGPQPQRRRLPGNRQLAASAANRQRLARARSSVGPPANVGQVGRLRRRLRRPTP